MELKLIIINWQKQKPKGGHFQQSLTKLSSYHFLSYLWKRTCRLRQSNSHPRKNALQMFPTDVSLHIPLRTNIVQGKAGVTPPNFTKREAEIKPYSVTPNNWVNMFLTFQSSTIHYFRPLSDV